MSGLIGGSIGFGLPIILRLELALPGFIGLIQAFFSSLSISHCIQYLKIDNLKMSHFRILWVNLIPISTLNPLPL